MDDVKARRSVVIHIENAVTCDDEKLLMALLNTVGMSIREQVPDARLNTVADVRRSLSYVIFDEAVMRMPRAPRVIRFVVIMSLPRNMFTKITARGKICGRLIVDVLDGFVDPIFYLSILESLNEKRTDVPILVCMKDTDFDHGNGWIDVDVDAMACCSNA